MTYTATIIHNSISRAREIKIIGTLAEAKTAAAAEFDGELRDAEIAIYAGPHDALVSSRRVSGGEWLDAY